MGMFSKWRRQPREPMREMRRHQRRKLRFRPATTREIAQCDVVITRHNSMLPVVLHAQNKRGERWIEQHLHQIGLSRFGNTVAIDRHFLNAIFERMSRDGITTNLERIQARQRRCRRLVPAEQGTWGERA